MGLDVDHLRPHVLRRGAEAKAQGASLGQALLGIEAEDAARWKQFGDRQRLLGRFGPTAVVDELGEPLGQVVGVVRVDTHARSVAVQGVTQLGSAVGLATSQLGTWFDDDNALPARLPEQLHGQQGAAQAASDDHYVGESGYNVDHV